MTGLARSAYFLLLISVLTSQGGLAQTGRVSGIVEDARGNPVGGANVVVTGTLFGTVTGADGSFSFDRVRYGSYELKVIHAFFAEFSENLPVDSPETTIVVRLREDDIDLSLSSLDGVEISRRAWDYQTGAGRTPAAMASDKNILLPTQEFASFIQVLNDLPGLVKIAATFDAQFAGAGQSARPSFAPYKDPIVLSTLPTPGYSAIRLVLLSRADPFGTHAPIMSRSISAGYTTNGGGPSLHGTFGGSSGKLQYALAGSFMEVMSDFTTGGSSRIDGQGRRTAASGMATYKIGGTSGLVLSSSVASLVDIPFPEIGATVNNGLSSKQSLQYRKGLAGALRYVDVKATSVFDFSTWHFPDTTFVLPLSEEDSRRNRVTLDVSSGGEFGAPFQFGVSGAFEHNTSTRTDGIESEALEISTLPDLNVLQGSASFSVAPDVNQVRMHAGLFAGVTSTTRDDAVDLGLVSDTEVVRGTVSGQAGATVSLNSIWDLQLVASHGHFAPEPQILFANGILVYYGQTAGTAFTELPASMNQSVARINLSGSGRIAKLLLSGVIVREKDALTLTPIEDRGTRQFRVDNTDRVVGSVVARSLSSALDLVFLELSGRLAFGRNTEFGEPPASIPQHAFGTSLYLRSPEGGSYLRAATVKYFERSRVSERLQESPTAGATVVDIGAGYKKGKVQVELGVDNLFDNTYRHHLTSITTSETFRLAEQGRNISLMLTYSFSE